LKKAIEAGDIKLVSKLLDKDNEIVNKRVDSVTPLQYAIFYRKFEIAKLLIKYGADVNAKGYRNNVPPLSSAAMRGEVGFMKLLFDNGADIDAKDRNNKTPLMYAASNCQKKSIEFLINKGANINLKDIYTKYDPSPRKNAFDYAQDAGCSEDIKKLLREHTSNDGQIGDVHK
jgi:ankyrin repeat protein